LESSGFQAEEKKKKHKEKKTIEKKNVEKRGTFPFFSRFSRFCIWDEALLLLSPKLWRWSDYVMR
jgi:hypothetical protein